MLMLLFPNFTLYAMCILYKAYACCILINIIVIFINTIIRAWLVISCFYITCKYMCVCLLQGFISTHPHIMSRDVNTYTKCAQRQTILLNGSFFHATRHTNTNICLWAFKTIKCDTLQHLYLLELIKDFKRILKSRI